MQSSERARYVPPTPICIQSAISHAAAKLARGMMWSLRVSPGDVIVALERAGMHDNSLVIFSTDNGGPTDGTNNNMMNNFPLRSGAFSTCAV